ncbi:YdgA family protein [Pectobacteriaceae bacterium CE90]|nr:YdgA family protein [Prodigiosinella sp. LS101]WJV55861.1 YdgA family protein [Prodigiosinella sp. LS101]WJV60224.1 YdgA family protein [Pectobacteriaceae bacterium C111]WJY17033.1 YdgA family protein [Pectobacteriaceae bacterium CE90]
MTKKSLVAAGIIVALGAVWTGASWFTGKQIEKNVAKFTVDLNARLKEAYPNAGLAIVYQNYQRGIFSSHLTYVLQSDGSANGHQLLSASDKVIFNETISHGPFPLAQIKKFNLLPAMASVHSELASSDPLKPLFKLTKNKPFVTAETRVAYNGDTRSEIVLIPVDYQSEEQKFSFSGATVEADISHDLRAAHAVGTVSGLTIEKKNPWGQTETLSIQGLALNSDTHKGKFDINLGDGKITLKSIELQVQGGDPVTINNFVVSSHITEDQTNIAGQLALGIDSLVLRDQNLGSAKMNISYDRFDGLGVKQFAEDYQKKAEELMQVDLDPETYQQQIAMLVLQHLPQLLKGNPSIKISPVSWKNAKGESTFTLSLDLTDPLKTDTAPQAQLSDEEAIFRKSVKNLDAKLNVPIDMLTELMVQVAPKTSSDEEKKQLEAMARQQAQLMASLGQMSQVTVTQNNAITSSLQYSDGMVTFNNQKIPLAKFIAPFITQPEGNNIEEQTPNAQKKPVTQ